MGKSRHSSHVALCDSSYVILFDDDSWSNQSFSNKLTKRMNWRESNIEFVTQGPNKQWFFRLSNGETFFNLKDDNLRDGLENSTVLPYDLHKKLNGRQKSSPKVKHITFGPKDTWWVSFQDGTSCCSPNLPSYIAKHFMQTECLVLDPIDEKNYFIFEKNGHFKWRVNDYFDYDMNDNDEKDDVPYIDRQRIRYTQTSINHQFSNEQTIDQLRHDLEHGITTVSEIPMINVIKTRGNNF